MSAINFDRGESFNAFLPIKQESLKVPELPHSAAACEIARNNIGPVAQTRAGHVTEQLLEELDQGKLVGPHIQALDTTETLLDGIINTDNCDPRTKTAADELLKEAQDFRKNGHAPIPTFYLRAMCCSVLRFGETHEKSTLGFHPASFNRLKELKGDLVKNFPYDPFSKYSYAGIKTPEEIAPQLQYHHWPVYEHLKLRDFNLAHPLTLFCGLTTSMRAFADGADVNASDYANHDIFHVLTAVNATDNYIRIMQSVYGFSACESINRLVAMKSRLDVAFEKLEVRDAMHALVFMVGHEAGAIVEPQAMLERLKDYPNGYKPLFNKLALASNNEFVFEPDVQETAFNAVVEFFEQESVEFQSLKPKALSSNNEIFYKLLLKNIFEGESRGRYLLDLYLDQMIQAKSSDSKALVNLIEELAKNFKYSKYLKKTLDLTLELGKITIEVDEYLLQQLLGAENSENLRLLLNDPRVEIKVSLDRLDSIVACDTSSLLDADNKE